MPSREPLPFRFYPAAVVLWLLLVYADYYWTIFHHPLIRTWLRILRFIP